jgi:hypothetical protein
MAIPDNCDIGSTWRSFNGSQLPWGYGEALQRKDASMAILRLPLKVAEAATKIAEKTVDGYGCAAVFARSDAG